MKFYAYVPRKDGSEPMGNSNRLRFELKTVQGAHRRAKNVLGDCYHLFRFTNFYDPKTFRRV